MLDVFFSIKGLLKIDDICIDNNVFRLHYKVTVIALLALSLLVTSNQYIGDPIDCIVSEEIPLKVMDTFCWIHSTFTIPNRLIGKIGRDVVQPGVASHVDGEDEVKYHKYYQWVCFVLFFQAMMFYVPRYLWKVWEGGKIKALSFELNCPILDNETKREQKNLLIEYFKSSLRMQNFYAYRFFFCELLNFLNVVGQIFFVDLFLDGEFSTYGSDVLRFTQLEQEDRIDPMTRVFPKITKCTFHKYGPSGSIQKFDGLCVLPVNVINEKIYVFLWFWFIILAFLSGLCLIYRLFVFICPAFRVFLLWGRLRFVPHIRIQNFSKRCKVGDWFLLYQLAKNIDPLIFAEFVGELCEKMERRERV